MDKGLDAALRELTNRVMGKPGVSGTALAERGGKPCLLVLVSDPTLKKTLPKEVGGYPVRVEVSGPIRPL